LVGEPLAVTENLDALTGSLLGLHEERAKPEQCLDLVPLVADRPQRLESRVVRRPRCRVVGIAVAVREVRSPDWPRRPG
jgi:hypothetical protein